MASSTHPYLRVIAAGWLAIMVAACSSLGAEGPGTGTLRGASDNIYGEADIQVVELDSETNARIDASREAQSFAQVFSTTEFSAPRLAKGDIISVTIWEAPPAVLFGGQISGTGIQEMQTSQGGSFPDQPVDETGSITVPFVGKVAVAGLTTTQLQDTIREQLRGKANDPQVLVRLVDNQANTVTVMGNVAQTRRVPLSSRGERLLDVLAQAGGPRQAVEETSVRIARGQSSATMPLDSVILDPAQNIALKAEDIVTVYHRPYSFIALGSLVRNAEVPFEGSGISLAQALGRAGGLREDRADIRGVFVFRFEDPAALGALDAESISTMRDGKVPVIYRLDFSKAEGVFVAQEFQVRDDDVVYVSNAPGADLRKLLQTLSNVALSTVAIRNSL